jgi:hypothetical protein
VETQTLLAILMGIGFLVGAAGHLYKAPGLVALGIGIIFVAVLLLPLGLEVSGR